MWSSKEATGNEEKKSTEPEMGYYPFGHWLGRTRRLGAHGARARGRSQGAGRRRALGRRRWGDGAQAYRARARAGRAGRQVEACRERAAGARRALGSRTGCRRTACAHLGVLAGLWAVHLVHSACF